MGEFVISLAGRRIGVDCRLLRTYQLCRKYLAEDGEVDFSVVIDQGLVHAEYLRAIEDAKAEERPFDEALLPMLEGIALYRQIANRLVDYDTLLFHGSAIAVDGEGYLFTALSGTGKSTHTRLWREAFGDRAVMINDDKPLLRVEEDKVYVCGTPWNGKHRLGENIMVPLKGLCILTRAKENRIEPITFHQAFPVLVQQTHRPEDAAAVAKVLELLRRMAQSTELYRLGCNMDPEAALVAYNGMNRKEETI